MKAPSIQTYPCVICGSLPMIPAPDTSGETVCDRCRPIMAKRVALVKRREAVARRAAKLAGAR